MAWTWAFVTPRLTGTRVYNIAGQLSRTEFGAFGYDGAGRIDAIVQQLFRPGDSDPTHDSIVRVATISRVRYDAVGRIVHFETANHEGSICDYSYDANGNRTASSRTLAGLTTTRNYQLAAGRNRPAGFTQTEGGTTSEVVYGYDANGALTSDGLRRFTYNREGRLAAVTTGAGSDAPTTRYAHNALGQRVFKTETVYPRAEVAAEAADQGWMQGFIDLFAQLVSSATTGADKLGTAYLYDERGSLLSETGTGGPNSTGSTHYIYLPTPNGPLPIAVIVNGQKFAVHSDHLNTPRRITNDQGQPVWQWAYSAFGETKPTTAHHRFADLDAVPNPGTANFAELVVNKRLDGMYFDAESGLFANWHRFYDPRTGRYTQGDPIGLGGGLNRNTFGAGNPLSNSDPNGLQVIPTPLGPITIPPPPVPPGAPASIDPENPYRRGAPPSLQIPWNPVTMIPKAIVAGCNALVDWMFSRGANGGDKDARTPTGQRGSPMDVPKGTNEPTTIGGRDFGGHALDQMQGRGVTPTPVEDTVQNGTETPGNKPGRTVHTSPDGRLTVVTEGAKVVTVIPK